MFNPLNADALFCPNCGHLLSLFSHLDHIKCEICSNLLDLTQIKFPVIKTVKYYNHSKPWLGELDQNKSHTPTTKEMATIREDCPKCDSDKMYYYTMQLRAADEGQTVFYECCKCGYKYNLNTQQKLKVKVQEIFISKNVSVIS